ncbi:hypothetical protein EPD60_08920 [Flaviaesturariibacter flavus]|uniref:Uncharacterized protein n=1 Tax=Flaviaesturariibacter flavus TaxID=2502780 RepID=A0A4R1BAW5_9BACT|nr:hypothetical protein [Flaviaesturariibacter flavus]TCJ14121.1 hypothetical protein EPD60_08920 [Flaviaesturariibacter flavus]
MYTPEPIRLSLIALLFACSLNAGAQAPAGKASRYKFTDTVIMIIPDELVKDAAANFAERKGIPDSLKPMLEEQLKTALLRKQPMQIQTRFVDAGTDSTIVTLSPEVEHEGLTMPQSYSRMVMKKGRVVSRILDANDQNVPIPPPDGRSFASTGRTRIIMGYACAEFSANDGAVTIWVTDALPSSINPGVKDVNVKGAILGFSIRSQSDQLTSVLIRVVP